MPNQQQHCTLTTELTCGTISTWTH